MAFAFLFSKELLIEKEEGKKVNAKEREEVKVNETEELKVNEKHKPELVESKGETDIPRDSRPCCFFPSVTGTVNTKENISWKRLWLILAWL